MKWYGQIGFETDRDLGDGITEPVIEEKNYYGDILNNTLRNDDSHIVTDFKITNRISIVSDPYAMRNLHKIVYVTLMGGSKWRVSSVEMQYPRLILSIDKPYKSDDAVVEEG